MKKMILAFVLVFALYLSACGGASGSVPQSDAGSPSESPSPVTPIPQEEQIQILEANRQLWAFHEFYESPWFYAFTDLDVNGRLEVIAASTQGSGIFTYVNFYEVRADGSGIDNLYHADVEIEGPDDWPEIVVDSLPCYYDAAEDRYWYPCEGVTHDGYAHQYYAWQALSLKDGVADWEFIASRNVDWDENGSDTTECRDAQGNVISLQDYDSAVERRFAGMQAMELKMSWTQVEIPFEGDPVETMMSIEEQAQSSETPIQQSPSDDSDSDWDYDSGSSSRSGSSSGYDGFTKIYLIILFVSLVISCRSVIKLNSHSTYRKSISAHRGLSSIPQGTWGFQLKPISEFKGKQPENSWLTDLYKRMQDAWGEGDLKTLQPDFTADCYAQYDRQLHAKSARGEKAHCQVLNVNSVIHGWNEDEHEYMMAVEIRAVIIAWNTNQQGEIISGSDTARKVMHYAWVLRKSKEGQEGQRHCPNCGALVDVNFALRCPHCDALLEQTGNGWALSSIQGISQKTL